MLAADGSYTYTPALNFTGTDSVDYTVTDGTLTDVGTLTVTVTPVNDAPVAVDDSVTATEDSVFSSTVEPDRQRHRRRRPQPERRGRALHHHPGRHPGAGRGRQLHLYPGPNFTGTDSVDYTVTDGTLTDVGTLTITVTPVNDPPVAVDDSLTVAEDSGTTAGNLAGNDTPSGDGGNVWALGTPASNGSAAVNSDGTFSYTPNANYNGADSFTYTLTDANGDVSTATVSITVTAVNDLPVAVADSVTVNEDTVFSGTLAGNDTPSGDGGNVWALATAAANGSAVVNSDGTFSYTPNANYNGADSFTYTLTDANGDVSTATVSVTVTAVNDLPVAVDDSLTVAEDSGTTAGTLAGNDTPSGDGGNVWALATAAANGSAVVNSDGTFSYTPNANYNGADSFTYTLTDANGDVSTATVSVTVTAVNDLPVAVGDSLTVAEDSGTTAGTLAGNDTPSGDGGNVWALATAAANGSAVVNSDGTFSYTPNANYNGADSFTYTLTDANGDVSTATVSITVTAVNDLPVAVADSVTVNEDTVFSGTLAGNDTPSGDGGNVWALGAPASNGSVVVNPDGSFSYTPNANYNGTDSFTYTLTDANGDVSTETVSITVTAVNDLPVAVADSVTVNEDTVFSGTLAGNDTPSGDGGNVWALATAAANGSAVVNPDGSFSYTPNANYNGADSFTYTLTDANGDVSTATVSITVTAVNDLPVAVADSVTVNEDTVFSGTLAGNDTPSGDGGNVWALGAPASHGSAVVNPDGSFSYTPNANYNGADSFTYTLTDANGDVSMATVSVTVTAVNDLPVAVADSVTVNEDTVFSGTLAGNDTPSGDGGNVWALATAAANGSAVVNSDGSFSYTPNANYNGADSFTYTLTDANGDVSTATVSITVTAVNDLPVAVADSVTVNEDTVFSGTLAGNDTPSGDGGNVWALGAPASNGSVVVNPDGSFSYTPNANYQRHRQLHLHAHRCQRRCQHRDRQRHRDGGQRPAGGGRRQPDRGRGQRHHRRHPGRQRHPVRRRRQRLGAGYGGRQRQRGGQSPTAASATRRTPTSTAPTASPTRSPMATAMSARRPSASPSTAVNDLPVAVADSRDRRPKTPPVSGTLAGNDTLSGDGGNVWALAHGGRQRHAVVNATAPSPTRRTPTSTARTASPTRSPMPTATSARRP